MISAGGTSVCGGGGLTPQIAREFGVTRPTIYHYLGHATDTSKTVS